MDDNVIGNRIRLLREEKGFSKAELARRLDLNTYNTVSSWEIGNSYPRVKELIKLVSVFDVSADYILGMSDER